MNQIIIVRKRKKKKKKEDNREEAYRSEERGRRDDCGLRLAASPISILSFFFWRESPESFPSYDLSVFSQDDAGFLFSIFHRTGTSKRRRSTPCIIRPKFLNI